MKIHFGSKDMPQNVPLWAFGRMDDRAEDFGYVNGVYDGWYIMSEDKVDALGEHDIILWSAAPFEDEEFFEALLEALAKGALGCRDHMLEDWMHRTVLRAVVQGIPRAKEMAATVLKTRDIGFSRYYG